jgi:hypothetical protein
MRKEGVKFWISFKKELSGLIINNQKFLNLSIYI